VLICLGSLLSGLSPGLAPDTDSKGVIHVA
jgi:hypothetical protein